MAVEIILSSFRKTIRKQLTAVEIVLSVAYCGIVDEPGGDVQVVSVGDAACVEEGPPHLDHLGAVLLVEGTRIRQEGRGQQDIANQPVGRT